MKTGNVGRSPFCRTILVCGMVLACAGFAAPAAPAVLPAAPSPQVGLTFELEDFQRFHHATIVDLPGAGGGKAVHLGESDSEAATTLDLPKGAYRLIAFMRTVDQRHDGIWVEVAGQKHPLWAGNYGKLTPSADDAEFLLPGGPVTVRFLARETLIDVDRFTLAPTDEGAVRAKIELERYKDLPFDFDACCFGGETFPKGDFREPDKVKQLLGAYTLRFRYYDAKGHEVQTAPARGRCGAVAEIVMPDGRISRRFRTLCRMPRPLTEADLGPDAATALPAAMGLDPGVAKAQAATVAEAVAASRGQHPKQRRKSAILWAGLSELAPDDPPVTEATHPMVRDRQWWVTFKRRLYGQDKRLAGPVPPPGRADGPPALVVREGAPAEAGLTEDAISRIDQVCTAWAEDSDEPFAVCLVRNGVIALHKAYGRRDRRPPPSVDGPYWMASITKLAAGTLLTRFIGLGLVDPDAAVADYLPPLRGVKMRRPLLVRHCYTHTSGLWGHFGSEDHDLEEQVADWAPRLAIGVETEYNGTGLELGGKVLEAVSGEALPHLYRKHLLGPLGMDRTSIADSGGGMRSTPLDMARLGQMLLNRGAYGRTRFFGEPAFQQFLPHRLVREIGPDTKVVAGLGCAFFDGERLGKGTFGHAAASAAIFRVSPEKGLVLVLCRNAPGENMAKYEKEFLAAVAAAVDGDAQRQPMGRRQGPPPEKLKEIRP